MQLNPWKDHNMHALKEARHLIEKDPLNDSAKILASLVLALEKEVDFAISDLYELSRDHFDLALRILKEWRLDRYYAGKARLFDTAVHVVELTKNS
jgi:hypothetical protein